LRSAVEEKRGRLRITLREGVLVGASEPGYLRPATSHDYKERDLMRILLLLFFSTRH